MESGAEEATAAELAALLRALEQSRDNGNGFPGTGNFDYTPLAPFFDHELSSFGDAAPSPAVEHHTTAMEREVVGFFADLFRAPVDDRWGYVTTGATEGNIYGLYAARVIYPDGLVYLSEAAHPSIQRAVDLLGMASVTIRVTKTGELNYEDLSQVMDRHRTRPAIVVANVGTATTGAVDDVRQIKRVLRKLAMINHYVHSDATLAGIPAALLDDRPGFDLADGCDSISVSGQEFIGTPFPCGAVILRRSLRDRIARTDPTGAPTTVITGTRNGHAALVLWYTLRRLGVSGLRERAERARDLADYLARRLAELGWAAWHHPHSLTVSLKTPPADLTHRWRLVASEDWSRVVCLPGVTRDQVDRFLADLRETVKPRVPAQTRLHPRPRVPATAA